MHCCIRIRLNYTNMNFSNFSIKEKAKYYEYQFFNSIKISATPTLWKALLYMTIDRKNCLSLPSFLSLEFSF